MVAWADFFQEDEMTLRDYFAAKVMPVFASIVAASDNDTYKEWGQAAGDVAVIAYAFADAMLEQRSKK